MVYEDDGDIAFLDTHPIAEGDNLVIPKQLYTNIFDIEPREPRNYDELR